jgi:hypothetical protein
MAKLLKITLSLSKKEKSRLVETCCNNLDYCNETLRYRKNLKSAMKEFDSWFEVSVLQILAPKQLKTIRENVVNDLKDWLAK